VLAGYPARRHRAAAVATPACVLAEGGERWIAVARAMIRPTPSRSRSPRARG